MKTKTFFYLNLLSNARYSTLPLTSFLEFEEASHDANDQNTEVQEYYYEAPNLARGVEGFDYIITYGANDNEEEELEELFSESRLVVEGNLVEQL